MKKRILSIFLCLVMVFSLLPFTASAASSIRSSRSTLRGLRRRSKSR